MAGLTLYYRGPLSSCNYTCDYCPFAKEWEEPEVLAADRAGLERFVAWASAWDGPELSILFTPWGEALVRSWYREALVALSHLPRVKRVAAQTNLSYALDWLGSADLATLALWTTWHPSQCPRDRFVRQCARLDAMGVRYSVGVVGLREHLPAIEALRAELDPGVQVWVNAYKRVEGYYAAGEVERITAVDPRFPDNRVYPSLGRACLAGETHFTVDGDGTVRRCHFIDAPLGNLYEGALDAMLARRPCTNAVCRCHIGYVHMPELGLYDVYGAGLMERIVEGP
ncbi:MAG: STM4011 family radical SAM protein [Alphaproteobacteria bacterium]|nr:STM4011 family radical SAM protein [Alphaproteobacteria bacterium]